MLIVGLTGGIGAGKSTVARLLAERGAAVIDVDALGRRVLEPGQRAHDAVVAEFGDAIVDGDGRIDRAALGAIVFGDDEALARLTAISHPAINAELVDAVDAVSDARVVVLDMAILVESNLGRVDPAHSYEVVVTVEADTGLRVRRAVARGMAEDEVRRRLAAQASPAQRREVADHVIVNDGSPGDLEAAVDALWRALG